MSKIKFSLLSIIEAIDKIELYTKEFDDSESFYYDQKSFDATMMQFIIIGEMISKLDENFKIKELKEFNISEYLDNKEIRDEYLAQVLKDGDKDELLQALENIEKAKT